MTNVLHFFEALLLIEAIGAAVLLPTLLLVAFIPKRLPAVRHKILAWSFAAALLVSVFSPWILVTVRNYRQASQVSVVAQAAVSPVSALKAAPVQGPAFHITIPRQITEQSTALVVTTGSLKLAGFAWLLLCYSLSILLILKSRPSTSIPGCRVSKFTRTPVTAWFGKHYIILPEGAEDWSSERLERVLAHEQAHITRRDWVSQLLANFMLASSGLNPIAWICARKLRGEAEHAADQQVLNTNASPTEYATDLLQIAKNARYDRNVAVLAMASKGSLKNRIKFVLNDSQPKGTSRFALCTSLLAGLALPAIAQVALDVAQADGLPVQADQIQTSTSRNPDIRSGLAIAGSQANGWIAKFADGTEAKFCGMWFGTNRGVSYFATEGEKGSATHSSDWEVGHPRRLNLIFAFDSSRLSKDQGAGIGSPSMDSSSEPKGQTYAGGYTSSSDDGKKTYVHGYLEINDPNATQFSVGLDFEGQGYTVSVIPLQDLLAGKEFGTPQGIVSLGHPTNAEKQCLRMVGLPKDDFGIRVERPHDHVSTFHTLLTDNPLATGEQYPDRGCGGQEDAKPGYEATQMWFKPEFKSRKYVVLQWYRSYHVDFMAIPIPRPKEGP